MESEDKQVFQVDGYAITSFDKLTGYDTDGNLDIIMENLQDFSIDQQDEKELLPATYNTKTLKKTQSVIGSGKNEILTIGGFETLLGEHFKEDNYIVRYGDSVTVTDNKVVLNKVPVGTVGKEIRSICIGIDKKQYPLKLTQKTEDKIDETSFAYITEDNTILFSDGKFEDDTLLIVYYDISAFGSRIINHVFHYNKVLELYIDVSCQNTNDEKFPGQFHFFQVDFSSEFSISGEKYDSVQNFEFTSLANRRGEHKLWHWDFTVFKGGD